MYVRQLVHEIRLQFDCCDKYVNENNLDNVPNHSEVFYANVQKINTAILSIIEYFFLDSSIDWQRMLILLRFKVKNVNIFQNINDPKSMNNQQKRVFRNFFNVIRNLFET